MTILEILAYSPPFTAILGITEGLSLLPPTISYPFVGIMLAGTLAAFWLTSPKRAKSRSI